MAKRKYCIQQFQSTDELLANFGVSGVDLLALYLSEAHGFIQLTYRGFIRFFTRTGYTIDKVETEVTGQANQVLQFHYRGFQVTCLLRGSNAYDRHRWNNFKANFKAGRREVKAG